MFINGDCNKQLNYLIRKSGFNQKNHGIGSDLFNHHEKRSYFIKFTYRGDSKAGSSLPPADASETGLVLDNAVRDSHLAAQSRQEHHQLK